MLISKTAHSTFKSERRKRNFKSEARIHSKTATCIESLRNSFEEITRETKKLLRSRILYLANYATFSTSSFLKNFSFKLLRKMTFHFVYFKKRILTYPQTAKLI